MVGELKQYQTSEIINHAFSSQASLGERESIATSVPTTAAPQSQASTQERATPDTRVGTGGGQWGRAESRFPSAIITTTLTPQHEWQEDATTIDMHVEGALRF